ncbi:hypothetical protein GCM10027176_30270 [Actinoallomurus bryophytorum]
MIRRLEIERDTVLALQDAIEKHVRLVIANKPIGDPSREPAGREDEESELNGSILKLRSRLMHAGATDAVGDYLDTVAAYEDQSTSENQVPLGLAYAEAQEALGAAFRSDGPRPRVSP